MASRNSPGGGYIAGSGAQEENLHRRTSLFHCLEDPYRLDSQRNWSYPLPEFGGAYSPNVPTFRSAESKGYAFLPEVEFLSFVSVAAYSNPSTHTPSNSKEELLTSKVAQDTKRKIKAIFSIALEYGHDAIVLSAFGCGAYRNPPAHMARLFSEVIKQEKYDQQIS